MKLLVRIAAAGVPALFLAAFSSAPVRAQAPAVVAPIVVDTAVPIIIGAVKPKPKHTGLVKFEGYVQTANIAQITLRAKGNETSLQTFTLTQAASVKMQSIVDKGGYQYGDKVTVYYDPTTRQAFSFKGKASKPI
jgi:hypothetical protein